MKPNRHTIYQIYCRIINTKNHKEKAPTQHIRDQIFGVQKRLQLLKNHQDSNRTKKGEIKKIEFSKNTLPTHTETSLTNDLKTIPRDGNHGIFGTVKK